MSKKIIITGTSRGIGFEMAKLFASEGHQVLALSRNEKPLKEQALERIEAFSFDISKTEDLHKVATFVKA